MYFFYLWSFSWTKDRRNIKFNTSLINARNSHPISVQIYSKMQLEQVCDEKNIHVSKCRIPIFFRDVIAEASWGIYSSELYLSKKSQTYWGSIVRYSGMEKRGGVSTSNHLSEYVTICDLARCQGWQWFEVYKYQTFQR